MKRLLKSLLAEDKLKHIVVSATICVALNLFLPWELAGLITLAIGIGKEIYDKRSGAGYVEVKDIVCDIIGIIIGVL